MAAKKTKKPAKAKSNKPKAKALPLIASASEDEKHLQEVGSRVVTTRLLEAATKRLDQAAEDEAILGPFSFDARWRKALQPELDSLRASVATKGVDEGAAHPSAEKVSASMTQADTLFKRYGVILSVAPHALIQDAPHVRNPHSPKEVGLALETVAKYVERKGKALASFGGTRDFVTQLRYTAKTVQAARTEHAKARAKLSPEVRDVWQTAGIIYLELARLSKAAHGLLPAERAAKYALDELHPNLRGAAVPPPPPAEAIKSQA